MSQSEVERFVGDLQADAVRRGEIEKAGSLEECVHIAAHHGYRFTLDEIRAFLRAKVQAPDNGLTDEELEKLAGGVTPAGHEVLVALMGRHA